MGALAVATALAGLASPLGTALASSPYRYAGDITNNAANQGVYGYIRAEGESYGGSSSNHMAAWLGSNTSATADEGNEDWIQAGYLIGTADCCTETSQVMFEETHDYYTNFTGELSVYPQYGLGNQFFDSIFTGQETSGVVRGQYYMFVGSTLIGTSWLISPTDTYQEALIEGYDASGSWPSVSNALFGTTGTNGSYNTSTELGIDSHQGDELWQGEISTDPYQQAPYSASWWVYYSAFHAYG